MDAATGSTLSAARDAVVPALGERAADLVVLRLLRAAARGSEGARAAEAEAADRLRAVGDDPDAEPQVTETEAALLAWADAGGADAATSLSAVAAPALCARLDALSAAARGR